MNAIEVSQVRKTYRGKVEALRGLDLVVPAGSVYGLIGPNGAGKSTLVKILVSVIRASSLQGTLLGKRVGDNEALRRVGYLPEKLRLPDYLTASEALRWAAGLYGLKWSEVSDRAQNLLEKFGLGEWQKSRVSTFSKGMRQRVGLAQAMICDPELLILDEPTDGVDPAGRREIRDFVEEMKKEGRTVLLNSHLLGELELICDRVAIVSQGQVKLEGNLEELTAGISEFELTCAEPLGVELADELGKKFPLACSGRLLKLKADRAAEVMPLLDELRSHGVIIENLQQHRESLEDIFMNTVGQDGPGAIR